VNELRTRKDILAREFAAQAAGTDALATQLQADLETLAQRQETEEVVRPYATDSPLPDQWSSTRWDILSSTATYPAIDEARAGLRRMQTSFRSLAAGKLDSNDLKVLKQDLDRLNRAVRATRTRGNNAESK